MPIPRASFRLSGSFNSSDHIMTYTSSATPCYRHSQYQTLSHIARLSHNIPRFLCHTCPFSGASRVLFSCKNQSARLFVVCLDGSALHSNSFDQTMAKCKNVVALIASCQNVDGWTVQSHGGFACVEMSDLASKAKCLRLWLNQTMLPNIRGFVYFL